MPNKDSLVWNYYKSSLIEGTRYGQCRFCNKKFVTHALRMRTHLRKCLNCPTEVKNKFFDQESKDVKIVEDKETNSSVPRNTTKNLEPNKKKMKIDHFVDRMDCKQNSNTDILMARAFYASSIPFRTVEDDYFLAALKALRPAYTPPSRWSLSHTLLNKEYARIETFVKYKIKNADSICIQTDGWTDISGNALINIVFTTPSPILYKAIDPKTNKHTADYMASLLCSVIDEVGSNKVHALVTDNASNMRATWELITKRYPNLTTYGCAAHGLNLMAKDVVLKINSIKSLSVKAKKIVQYFRQKHLPRQILKQITVEKMGHDICLKVPVETRWGSMADCLRSLLACREYLELAVLHSRISQDADKYGIRDDILSDRNFWQILRKSLLILDSISTGIKSLEGERGSMEKVYPVLKKVFDDFTENLETFEESEKAELLDIFNRRRQLILHDSHLACHLLDPKNQGKLLDENEKKRAMKFIITIGKLMKLENLIVDLAEYIAKENFFDSEILWQSAEEMNSIVWWKGLCSTRALATLATRILNFPATSCSCERNWKDFSLIKTKKRNRLTVETTIKLAFIKYNLRLASTSDIDNCLKVTSDEIQNDNEDVMHCNEFESLEGEEDDTDGESFDSVDDTLDNETDSPQLLEYQEAEYCDDVTQIFIGTEHLDMSKASDIIDESEYLSEVAACQVSLGPSCSDADKITKYINLCGRKL